MLFSSLDSVTTIANPYKIKANWGLPWKFTFIYRNNTCLNLITRSRVNHLFVQFTSLVEPCLEFSDLKSSESSTGIETMCTRLIDPPLSITSPFCGSSFSWKFLKALLAYIVKAIAAPIATQKEIALYIISTGVKWRFLYFTSTNVFSRRPLHNTKPLNDESCV